ncbi:MAG: hypothetical protein M3161_07600 [Actinomycetota bacterium]|nr:hypothetical protein [Actinomycetota bacterium]
MTHDDFAARLAKAEARARSRLMPSRRVGVAYVGPAARDPREAPPSEWRGVVVATDGANVHELLVVAPGVSRHAELDEEALADAIERLAADAGTDPLKELREATQAGPGLRLDIHASDLLRAIFP